VNLVEVESCEVLNRLVALLPDQNYRPYLIQSGDSATRQVCPHLLSMSDEM